MTDWTREHDAVIALECESVGEIFKGNQNWPHDGFGSMKRNPMDIYYVAGDENGHAPVSVPRYSTDLAACFRAAEALRAKDESLCIGINSSDISSGWFGWINFDNQNIDQDGNPIPFTRNGVLYDTWPNINEYGATPSAALAWALYNAVKGTK